MRGTIVRGGLLLAFLLVAAPAAAQLTTDPLPLAAFAQQSGLRDISGFVDVVQSLRATGHLPPRYVAKEEAAAHGWRGGGLCTVWPGHAIGGDLFTNAGHPLPRRVYREADLDETCDHRGPKRLIFADDGAIFVTTDHYNSFTPVP